MASTRELRRHIRSIRSTRQITKAMELVAASKLRRASEATLAARPYALRIAEALRDALIAPEGADIHPLLLQRTVTTTLLVVISSDRGLAGPYNTAIIKEALEFITQERAAGRKVECITLGRKAEQALNRLGITVVESYPHSSTHPVATDVMPLARSVVERFISRECDRVTVLSTDYQSAFKQEAHFHLLLPLATNELVLETAGDAVFTAREQKAEALHEHMFLYEPTPQALLDVLIPRYLETILYQLLQDSLTSEHAARRLAMRSATDNANDIIEHLELTYNSVRQSSITQEIAEITSATLAFEQ